MKETDLVYLKHILESIYNIERSTEKISEEEFKKNVDLVDANLRRIEIIGEAAKNLSDKFKIKYSDIEWKKIAGTRDVLIHAYFTVDLGAVWIIIKKDLLELKNQIETIIKDIVEVEKKKKGKKRITS